LVNIIYIILFDADENYYTIEMMDYFVTEIGMLLRYSGKPFFLLLMLLLRC